MSRLVIRTAALAATALLSFAPASLRAQDGGDSAAAVLLAKHKVYAGWSLDDKAPKTLRISGEVSRDGKVLHHFRTLREGGIFASDEDQSQGFTGRIFWQSMSGSGFIVQPKGEAARFRIADDMISTEALTEMSGKVVGHRLIDGADTTIVRVSPDAAFPIDLYIDPSTGAYKRITIDPDGKYNFSYNNVAYADIAGGRKIVDTYTYDNQKSIHHVTKIIVDAPIADAELHPPKPIASWSFGDPTVRVPISVGDKEIHLDAVVNGVKGHFILDTGAGGIFFTDTFARRAGAKKVGTDVIQGIAASANSNEYDVETIAFGPHVLKNVRVETGLDESAYGSEERGDGVIGFDLLGGAIVNASLDDGYLTIQDPATVTLNISSGVPLNVDLSTGTPRVPMQISDRVPVLVTLDSGNAANMLFSQDVIDHDRVVLQHNFLGPDGSSVQLQERIYGVNGYEDDLCGTIDRMSVGPITYQHVPACASRSYSRNDVLVGFDFIKHFNYIFDYPEGVIVMIPRKGER